MNRYSISPSKRCASIACDALADVALLVEDRDQHAHVHAPVRIASGSYAIEGELSAATPVEPKGFTGRSGGRLRENGTDASPFGPIRARRWPLRGPLEEALEDARSNRCAACAAACSRPCRSARSRRCPSTPPGVRPQTRTPLAGAERDEREAERLQRRRSSAGRRRCPRASQPQARLHRARGGPVAQPVPDEQADARVPRAVERLGHPARVQAERHALRVGGRRVPAELRDPELDRAARRDPLLLARRSSGASACAAGRRARCCRGDPPCASGRRRCTGGGSTRRTARAARSPGSP